VSATLRPHRADLLVLVAFVAISFALFGWQLLPHPGRNVFGYGHNPEIYVWSFAWWLHALAHGLNPFYSHYLYAPGGVNLSWTLTVPGLALVFTPLTALVGPVASYNVASVLVPAAAAWTGYLLCRYLTRSIWAGLIGGYLFGFSSYVVRQQIFGNLPPATVFLFPLVALVLVRYIRGELDRRGLVWRLGLLLGFQFWLTTEYALTLTLVLVLALALAYWLIRSARERLRSALPAIAGAYAVGAVVAAPLVVYAITGYVSGWAVEHHGTGTDLLNLFVPTRVLGIGGSSLASVSKHLPDHGGAAYLGLPTLVVVAAYGIRNRRAPGARFLIAAFAVALLIVLGPDLRVYNHRLIPLPWSAVDQLPFVSGALVFRFGGYLALAAGVIVALWTATTKGWLYPRPYVLPLLCVVTLVPGVWRTTIYGSFHPLHPERPAFFAADLYKGCLPRGETVAIFPFAFGGDSLVWQAESDFWFKLASDGLQAPVRTGSALNDFDADPVVHDLNFLEVGRPTADTLVAFAALHHVDRVLSSLRDGYPNGRQMEHFGPARLVGGMLVSPACGKPSLARRDLSRVVAAYRQRVGRSFGYCAGPNFILVPQEAYPTGALRNARLANYVSGSGLTCLAPPAGYKRRGFATPDMGVPAHTYPYYAP
jgi:hypothetical protein